MASILARVNEQYSQCALYPLDARRVKVVSNSSEQLGLAREQLQFLLSIPSTDTFNLDGGRKLIVKKGNIESESVTSLVCPSNSRLQHSSGIAAKINAASQCTLQKKSEEILQKCEPLAVGNIVMVTGGGALRCKYVYQVVLPDTLCGPQTSYAAVQDIVLKVLGYAEKHKILTIALPLLTSEVFSDETLVAKLMVESVIDYKFANKLPVLSDVVFCIASENDFSFITRYLYQKMVERSGSGPPSIAGQCETFV